MKITKKLLSKLDKPLVVFDLETTDKNSDIAETIQFAAVKIDNKTGQREEIKYLIKPSVLISEEATEIHHISNFDVEFCPAFGKYARRIVEFFEGCYISGYNSISYDAKILGRQLIEAGEENILEKLPHYDAFLIYKKDHPRKLANAFEFYTKQKFSEDDQHDALNDVNATVDIIFSQIKNRDKNINEIISEELKEKDGGIERHIVFKQGNPFINFGKHKGKSFNDVETGYFMWIMKSNFPNEVKSIIGEYLKTKV